MTLSVFAKLWFIAQCSTNVSSFHVPNSVTARPLRHRSQLFSSNPEIPKPISLLFKSESSDRRNDLMLGEDSGMYNFENEKWGALGEAGWVTFFAAVAAILTAVAVLWVYPSTGYGDDFVSFLEKDVAHGNSHLVTLAFGIIFPIVHSGLASLRPYGEKIVGARMWRVIFAFPSLCLAYSWIVYFISHAHDGIQFYDISQISWVHSLAWLTNFMSFLFLYPSVYNLKEVRTIILLLYTFCVIADNLERTELELFFSTYRWLQSRSPRFIFGKLALLESHGIPSLLVKRCGQ